MEHISRDSALARLREHQKLGHHVDERVIHQVSEPGELNLWQIRDPNEFLSLIFQARNESRHLTPPGEPRTLRHVAARILERRLTFEQLASDLGIPRLHHNPRWFRPCIQIDRDFRYSDFGVVTVTTPVEAELAESPGGNWYIYDGTHKALVLAKRLLTHEERFVPIEALVLTPRRE